MYLSRIPLDTARRKTQIALFSPSKFHGAVEEAFQERDGRKLWRIDTLKGMTYLLMLSAQMPNLSGIAEQFGYEGMNGETKSYDGLLNRIQEGSIWQFRLVANPVHSIGKEEGRGKVVAHTTEKYQLEWLNGQAGKKGFSIVSDSARVTQSEWKIFRKGSSGQKVHILQAAFEGKLKVEDTTAFKDALINGIGREKAYGMGLLTIAGREA